MSRKPFFKLSVALLVALHAAGASAAMLFFEDFEGYTSFPTVVNTFTVPSGGLPQSGTVQERINAGIPMLSEGAKEKWYGARFEDVGSSTNSIDSDLSVQNYGSINRPDDPNANYTHVGRFEDDAGLVFRVSTLDVTDARLSFNWRTYNVESADVVRVGYRTSNPGFGACDGNGSSGCFADLRTGVGSWNNWNAFTLSDAATTSSPKGNSNNWIVENFLLPADKQEIWVAFWLDNGESDIGKIDNVLVSATAVSAIPLPGALWLLASALGALGIFGFRPRVQQLS